MKTLVLAAVLALACGGAAEATPITYVAFLSGPSEAPPNASPGTGFARVTIDTALHTLQVDVTFSGLTAGNTAAHIHCCTASPETGTAAVATVTPTFTGFPGGVTSGIYSHLFDLTLATSWNTGAGSLFALNGGAAGAEIALAAGLASQEAYLNIHTSNFPQGEIRGFLEPIPEPATLALLGLGLVGIAASSRGRRR